VEEFEKLINLLLESKSPKKWFRAYFNHGLINYIYGQPRLLPCEMGTNAFFLDPYGDIIPCNGMTEKMSMGNLHDKDFYEIWNSEQAKEVRDAVKNCNKNCWMIGSASPAMHQRIWVPSLWVLKHKLKGNKYSISENSFIDND
jgi:sulfatase maturation enzyme AslB (radical SAM superfamily)